jgi:hypothetical protein
VLDLGSIEQPLATPVFGMKRPDEALDRHRRARLRAAWDGTLAWRFGAVCQGGLTSIDVSV